jgi:hypothetical protein
MAVIGAMGALAILVGGIAMYLNQPDRALARREASWHQQIEPGDVVLQELACGLRCHFITDVTNTRYTNVGLVLEQNGRLVVWDGFGRVDFMPLGDWIDRGKGDEIAVYRPEGVNSKLSALAAAAQALRGTPYDPDFEWDDSRMYPAEFVAKVFARAGIPIVQAHPLGKGAFGSHANAVIGLTEGKLTEQTPMVMPVDFVRSPKVHKVIDELEGAP